MLHPHHEEPPGTAGGLFVVPSDIALSCSVRRAGSCGCRARQRRSALGTTRAARDRDGDRAAPAGRGACTRSQPDAVVPGISGPPEASGRHKEGGGLTTPGGGV
jgi:hypothetical protein